MNGWVCLRRQLYVCDCACIPKALRLCDAMNRRWAVGGLQGYGGSGAIKSSVILGGAAGVSGDKSSESPSFCPSHSTHGGFLQGGGMMKLMMLCHHPLLLHNNRWIKLEYGTFKCKWKSVAFRCLQNYFRLCWLNLLMPGNFLDILQYTEYTHWKNEIDIKQWWAGPGVSKQKGRNLDYLILKRRQKENFMAWSRRWSCIFTIFIHVWFRLIPILLYIRYRCAFWATSSLFAKCSGPIEKLDKAKKINATNWYGEITRLVWMAALRIRKSENIFNAGNICTDFMCLVWAGWCLPLPVMLQKASRLSVLKNMSKVVLSLHVAHINGHSAMFGW